MTEYSASPVSQSESATSEYAIPHSKLSVNKKSSITPETDAKYMSVVNKGDLTAEELQGIINQRRVEIVGDITGTKSSISEKK